MAKNTKQTSPQAASAASKVLRDGRTGKASKTAAGSALAQTPSKKKQSDVQNTQERRCNTIMSSNLALNTAKELTIVAMQSGMIGKSPSSSTTAKNVTDFFIATYNVLAGISETKEN